MHCDTVHANRFEFRFDESLYIHLRTSRHMIGVLKYEYLNSVALKNIFKQNVCFSDSQIMFGCKTDGRN